MTTNRLDKLLAEARELAGARRPRPRGLDELLEQHFDCLDDLVAAIGGLSPADRARLDDLAAAELEKWERDKVAYRQEPFSELVSARICGAGGG